MAVDVTSNVVIIGTKIRLVQVAGNDVMPTLIKPLRRKKESVNRWNGLSRVTQTIKPIPLRKNTAFLGYILDMKPFRPKQLEISLAGKISTTAMFL